MARNSSIEWNETLLKMATPNIYRINAFRILNLSVTASPKEISARARQLDLKDKYGVNEQQIIGDFFLSSAQDSHSRREAQQRLLDPELRFIDEFFWFWPLSFDSTIDSDEALIAIREGKISAALSIWERRELEGSEANVSKHNLAVLYHAMALDIEHTESKENQVSAERIEEKRAYWDKSFSRWHTLLNDEGFWKRVRQRIGLLDDPRLTSGTVHRIREGLPAALLSINAQLAVEAVEMNDTSDALYHLKLIRESGFDDKIIDEAIHRATVPIRDRLRAICTHAGGKTGSAPEHDDTLAEELIKDASPSLQALDLLLPEGDDTRESAHDEVALQIRSCLLSYCNKTENWRNTLRLSKEASEVAASSSVRQKIQEDITAINNNLKYSTCWFCGITPANDSSAVNVMMYGNVQREKGFLETKVRYQRLPVPVPRCKKCESAHKQRHNLGCAGPIVGLILAILIGIAVSSFLAAAIVFAFCWLVFYLISVTISPKGIRPESYKNEFSTVREMQSHGWNIGEKPS